MTWLAGQAWTLFQDLSDWRLQLAVVALAAAFAFGLGLLLALRAVNTANGRVRKAGEDRDAAVATAESDRDRVTQEAARVVVASQQERDQALKRLDQERHRVERLESLWTSMIGIDEFTITEMVDIGADATTKRNESVRLILHALVDVLATGKPGKGVRVSFIECMRDGGPCSVALGVDDENYSLRVLKHEGLTEAEKTDIAHLPKGIGLVNRAIVSGETAYVPDIDSPDAEKLGYWRPNHRVGYRSIICVPAHALRKTVGVLCADSPGVDGFGDWETSVLEHFARKIVLRYASLPPVGLWD